MGKQSDLLDDITDHAAQADHVPLADGAPVYAYIAFAGHKQMINEFETGGLAGATAAEEDQGFAALYFEVQFMEEGVAAVETRGDVAEFYGWAMVGGVVHVESFSSPALLAMARERKMPSRQPAGRRRYKKPELQNLVRGRRQTGDANSGVALVPDVQSDQERSDLLQDARAFQFAAIDGAHARNSCGQRSHGLTGAGIIAADDYVAVHRAVRIQQFGGDILERGHDRYALGNQFHGLLRGGALPDTERASGSATDAGSQGHGSVNHNTAGANRRLDSFQQSSVAFKRNGEQHEVRGGACVNIFFAGNLSMSSNFLSDPVSRILRTFGVARPDDHGFACLGPAQGEAQALRTGASEDGDGAGHVMRAPLCKLRYANSVTRTPTGAPARR